MDAKSWKQLRAELESRGYKVTLVGKHKHEYYAEKGSHIIDIYRGGITGTGSYYEVYIYDVDTQEIEFNFETRSSKQLMKFVDDYEDFE